MRIGYSPLYGENKRADALLTECGAEWWFRFRVASLGLLGQMDQTELDTRSECLIRLHPTTPTIKRDVVCQHVGLLSPKGGHCKDRVELRTAGQPSRDRQNVK